MRSKRGRVRAQSRAAARISTAHALSLAVMAIDNVIEREAGGPLVYELELARVRLSEAIDRPPLREADSQWPSNYNCKPS